MYPKTPPEVLSPSEMAYMSGLNEKDRRLFLATRAENLRSQGLSYRKFSKKMGISTHTPDFIVASPILKFKPIVRVNQVGYLLFFFGQA